MRYLSEIFGGIPRMFVHCLQIILNFLYVCQSVSWLSSLLILYKYSDISTSERDIFLKISGDLPGMLAHWFQIILKFLYVCQSVICLTSLLILYKYRDNSSSGWNIFLKFLGDILGTLVHYFQIFLIFLYVCQSVSWLTSL